MNSFGAVKGKEVTNPVMTSFCWLTQLLFLSPFYGPPCSLLKKYKLLTRNSLMAVFSARFLCEGDQSVIVKT